MLSAQWDKCHLQEGGDGLPYNMRSKIRSGVSR